MKNYRAAGNLYTVKKLLYVLSTSEEKKRPRTDKKRPRIDEKYLSLVVAPKPLDRMYRYL